MLEIEAFKVLSDCIEAAKNGILNSTCEFNFQLAPATMKQTLFMRELEQFGMTMDIYETIQASRKKMRAVIFEMESIGHIFFNKQYKYSNKQLEIVVIDDNYLKNENERKGSFVPSKLLNPDTYQDDSVIMSDSYQDNSLIIHLEERQEGFFTPELKRRRGERGLGQKSYSSNKSTKHHGVNLGNNIFNIISSIPEDNRRSVLDSALGFVYEQMDDDQQINEETETNLNTELLRNTESGFCAQR